MTISNYPLENLFGQNRQTLIHLMILKPKYNSMHEILFD